MAIGRRGFLAGAAAIGSSLTLMPGSAKAAETERGRSVTEFGVDPSATGDQREALQKAIHEISATGQPVYIPAGLYRVSDWIELPPKCILNGDPGRTVLSPRRVGGWVLLSGENQSLQMSGLVLDGRAEQRICLDLTTCLALLKGGTVIVRESEFRNATGAAIQMTNVSGIFALCNFYACYDGAFGASHARSLLVRQCRFEGSGSCYSSPRACLHADGKDIQILDNFASKCSAGFSVTGNGEIRNNTIAGPAAWAMRLGYRDKQLGAIAGSQRPPQEMEEIGKPDTGLVVTGNTISGCDVGIVVASRGEAITISDNIISVAKDGAIRALEGDKLVGPDLAREGAQAYPGLAARANVIR